LNLGSHKWAPFGFVLLLTRSIHAPEAVESTAARDQRPNVGNLEVNPSGQSSEISPAREKERCGNISDFLNEWVLTCPISAFRRQNRSIAWFDYHSQKLVFAVPELNVQNLPGSLFWI
jgi:hypothetical protein